MVGTSSVTPSHDDAREFDQLKSCRLGSSFHLNFSPLHSMFMSARLDVSKKEKKNTFFCLLFIFDGDFCFRRYVRKKLRKDRVFLTHSQCTNVLRNGRPFWGLWVALLRNSSSLLLALARSLARSFHLEALQDRRYYRSTLLNFPSRSLSHLSSHTFSRTGCLVSSPDLEYSQTRTAVPRDQSPKFFNITWHDRKNIFSAPIVDLYIFLLIANSTRRFAFISRSTHQTRRFGSYTRILSSLNFLSIRPLIFGPWESEIGFASAVFDFVYHFFSDTNFKVDFFVFFCFMSEIEVGVRFPWETLIRPT